MTFHRTEIARGEDHPDTLLTASNLAWGARRRLERCAEEERAELAGLTGDDYDAQWRRWREASEEVQAAVTGHAAAANVSRYELEQPVKKAVRHAQGDPAAE
ncbi:hypothetical protein ACPCA8_34385 [Streptomyces capoamus]|uniref:hypothetical protein n=1 Tax=Streptomyces capoamus TaxID=68183 RepID=UPI003C308B0A